MRDQTKKLNKKILWHQDRIADLTAGHSRGLEDAESAELLAHHVRELHLLQTFRKVAQ